MQEEANLSVGMVAKRTGIAVSTLHFYEQKGLITSLRNQGNQRRFKREVLRRIAIIKAAQKFGVSLDEIKLAFDALPDKRNPTKDDWSQLAAQWQKMLDEKINAMTQLKNNITGCIGCGCLSLVHCPIYNENDKLAAQGDGAHLLFSDH
ncbi:redox-sensitive transcriptional activator SoxR [Pseudoalteromonas tunicata]|jgi:MerR family redox-sensitive transcriptional activator SoxR|uniref:Redox-sensitive transcriptional activator SoxR n=1 Tax=Pseudoalteromonas tunicata D2 TaxID=87626 RepID=A4CDV8_9GAMM|nr:redox-sensitive transcriptional activator SoxR [Pseudoalteromonas tunicata]ATC96357.1 MerR family transcriptional regulator, redox-sensitive transcriptional activator SoxR [Pseudoalteromonas tunicata]AXT31854.1 redox-sensitive transcriptional activator SoxR [Pseudoalteromonas tunicata]EAR27150.1 Transcriptional Regulator, MerR family protein [Pseudoalteromonas tunicata D2]MDP4984587.1 redox-sensitive transcriptional activator SoxR [Pseudoalteromonas tunicata]MDP5212265.1 redox-sensitive tra